MKGVNCSDESLDKWCVCGWSVNETFGGEKDGGKMNELGDFFDDDRVMSKK